MQMESSAGQIWRHAPAITQLLDQVGSKPKVEVVEALLTLLGVAPSADDVEDQSKQSIEEFEYALHSAILTRLEGDDDQQAIQAIDIVDVAATIVAEVFERAARPGMHAGETDRCRVWWSTLLSIAEDASRLIPTRLLDRFVQDLEKSLVRLRAAYLNLATQRLVEFDIKQAAEIKAAEESKDGARKDVKSTKDGKDTKDGKEPKDSKDAKDSKDKEAKRVEERKKLITHLGISPNGQLYLTLTSLLKQLSSRLCSSLHAGLRARIVLLLERVLAMDHKAIANNQKLGRRIMCKLKTLTPMLRLHLQSMQLLKQ